jgi:hypothetical protein
MTGDSGELIRCVSYLLQQNAGLALSREAC